LRKTFLFSILKVFVFSPIFWFFGHVPFHVKREMVGPGEAAFAHSTLERLGARVLPVVPGQLVGPGEPPLAIREMARVRFFT
jgi:hypothetical protein